MSSYGVWGDFDVTINIDKDYTVAGSGYLQNPEEVGHGYAELKEPYDLGKTVLAFFSAPMFMILAGLQTQSMFMML